MSSPASTSATRRPSLWTGAIGSALLVALLSGCARHPAQPISAGVGPDPQLPEPASEKIPTLKVAKAVGWDEGETPSPGKDLAVQAFATGLDHPRWLHVLPNGDVLVAESNRPAKAPPKGIKAWFKARAMKKAGAATVSADRITLLRDADGDGVAELRTVFRDKLRSPFGMALVGDQLYIANTDALLRYPYRTGMTGLADNGEVVSSLPAGELNHHWTKNVIAARDGRTLYVTVGSNSNVAENGIHNEAYRANILTVDPRTGRTRVFASGLRNPNGMAWNPDSGALWTVVNERDEIGNDLVPDYLTSVHEGDFFGWPYAYWGPHADQRVQPQRPELVRGTRRPDYALGSHVAALGLTFVRGDELPPRYRDGALIGLHGSWNRKPPSGYEVIFVPFRAGKPDGMPVPVLSGFLDERGQARGRPVGVEMGRDGAVLVADDVGNVIWRVSAAPGKVAHP